MQTLAAVFGEPDTGKLKGFVERMLDATPYRARTRHVARVGRENALAYGEWSEVPIPARGGYGERDGVHVVVTARWSELGTAAADVVLNAYASHGADLARHLRGDFAFVLWDARARRLLAGRDPFGMRPLFFRVVGPRILLASEVAQLLASSDCLPPVDEESVCAFLLDETHEERTFFRGVRRVPAGHELCVETDRGASDPRVRRCFVPSDASRPVGARHAPEQFRSLFYDSVRVRLEASDPLLLQLSGGLDSSSVVLVADALYRAGVARAPATVVSAIFPDSPWDESRYVSEVVRRIQLPHEAFRPTEAVVSPNPEDAYPYGRDENEVFAGCHAVARRRGAHVLVCGLGGDELLFEEGVGQDLAARGKILRSILEALFDRYSSRGWKSIVARALDPYLPRWMRTRRGDRPRPTPQWWTDKVRRAARELRCREPVDGGPLDSFTARATWGWLIDPRLSLIHELEELSAARSHVELRAPFLDWDLACFVLSLPFEARLPHGLRKRLLRDALAKELPSVVRTRTQVTTFEGLAHARLLASRETARDLIERGPWLCAPYVDRHGAKGLLQRWVQSRSPAEQCELALSVWDVVLLERWLRRLADFQQRQKPG